MEIMRRTGISKPIGTLPGGSIVARQEPAAGDAAAERRHQEQDDARDAAGRDPLERADGARGRHQAVGLKPHLVDSFKVSNDPLASRTWSPLPRSAGKAVVFSVDEKSQIQALDRSQPGLPIGTMTHDYKRGTIRGATCSMARSSATA